MSKSNREELAELLQRMADAMERNPTRSGNPIIGISSGGGTGISSIVSSSSANYGTIIGMSGSVTIGSPGENDTIQALRDAAGQLQRDGGSQSLLDAALAKVVKFGGHVIDYSTLSLAQRLGAAIFG